MSIKPVAWHTEDHADDYSATTYYEEVAGRWKKKGWPVTPMYYAIPDTHRVVPVALLKSSAQETVNPFIRAKLQAIIEDKP